MGHKASRVEVILKVAERCNINCSYCYYLNMGNHSASTRPAFIGEDTVDAVAAFLVRAVVEWEADEVVISLHGGEPLLMKKPAFEALCRKFREQLAPIGRLVLVLQTNGMLVDDDWVEIFRKFGVHVGISIDGPREVHDRFRIDHQGRGTHDRVVAGLRRLQAASAKGLIPAPGVLTVLDPAVKGDRLYRYLVYELGVRLIDVLLPHATHDDVQPKMLEASRTALGEMFQAWTYDDDPSIQIRTFKTLLERLGRPPGYVEAMGRYLHRTVTFTIFSDGELACEDNLHSLGDAFSSTGLYVHSATPQDLLSSPMMIEVTTAADTLPADCSACPWQNICGGGNVHERFSSKHRFAEKTVYCRTMESLLESMSRYLVRNGLPVARLRDTLSIRHPSI